MSITPRHLAGLAGNYTFADLPIPTTTSTHKSRGIAQADLARQLVLPLTPPSSDTEKNGKVPLSAARPVRATDKGDSEGKGKSVEIKVKVRDFARRVIVEDEDDEVEQIVKEEPPVIISVTEPEFALTTTASSGRSISTSRPTSTRRSHLLNKLGRYMYLYRLSQIQAARSSTRQRRKWMTPGQVRVLKALLALDQKEESERNPAKTARAIKQETPETSDDVGAMLVDHLKGMLQAKTPILTDSPLPITPNKLGIDVKAEADVADLEEIDIKVEPTPFPTFEREPPLFLRRPPTPGSNPIRYPRGYVPPAAFHSSAEESTGEEVSIEFVKAVPRVIKVLQGMTSRMREKFDGEAWVRRLDDEVKAGLIKFESDVEEAVVEGKTRMVRDEVERFLVDGKQGEVTWEEGVGKLVSRVKVEEGQEEYGDVHVFLDHSNIHHGMISTLVSRPLPNLSLGSKKILNIPILSLLMLRGRRSARDGMHLVASAPLTQGLDSAVKMGWRCCVLKRVEVDRRPGDGSSDSEERGREQSIKSVGRKGGKKAWTSAVIADETTTGGSATESDTPSRPLVLPNLNDPSITSRRMREQAVDELLHLQILQTLLFSPQPGTLVLGTGDAKGGQFNELGFLGCVKLAVEKGWKVELWSWRKGMSRMWREEARRMGWSRRQFKICELDDWVEEVVMERESSGKRSKRR